MLPSYASNPKSPKRGRGHPQHPRGKITPKVAVVGVFVLFNLGWFANTLLPSSSSKQAPAPKPHQPTRAADAPGLYVPQHHAGPEGGLHPSQRDEESEEGGLLRPRASAGLSQEQLMSGSLEDLVVKGSLLSGDLKLSGHVLSSGTGKLLVSAGAVGIGTSAIDTEHDVLVVNGPIRLTDSGTRPRCDASKRGMIWHEFGDVGQEDSVSVCAKGRDEGYGWRAVVGTAGGGAAHQQMAQHQLPLSQGSLGAGVAGGLSREFRVALGSEVQPGDVVTFVDGQVKRGLRAQLGEPAVFVPPSAAATMGGGVKRRTGLLSLGGNLCIVVHGGGTGQQAVAQVVEAHGTSIELKSKLPFGAKKGDHAELATLSDSSFVIAYADASQREVGYLVVGILAGNQLRSFSQPLAFEPSGCSSLSVAALSGSLIVTAFNGNAASGKGIPTVLPARVDGRKIVPGNRTQVEGRLDGFVLVPLSACHFVLVYRNLRTKGAAARLGRVETVQAPDAAGDGDGDEEDEELPLGPREQEQAFLGREVAVPTPGRILTYLVAAKLSPALMAVAYADSEEGHVVLVDLSGEALSPRPPVLFSSTKPLSLSLSALGTSSFLLTYYSNNPWQATAVKMTAHGDGRGAGVSMLNTVIGAEYTSHTHSVALSPVRFLMTFYDGANSDAGTAVAGTFGRGFGVAAAGAAGGQMVPVRFGGVSGDHMSLEVGSCYFSSEDGRLTTTDTAQSVGLAISVNEILINGCSSSM